MNVQKNSQSQQPLLCKSCNKFFGTEAHQGLCSKCYGSKHNIDVNASKKNGKQQKPKQGQKKQQAVLLKGIQENKSKCFSCKKKVGLLGVECKCGYVFCNAHRLPEDHQCSINYEQKGKQKLRKQIIKVEHGKLTEL